LPDFSRSRQTCSSSADLPPAAGLVTIAVAIRPVSRRNPDSAAPRRPNPGTSHPEVISAAPIPVSVDPNISQSRRHAHGSVSGRRRWRSARHIITSATGGASRKRSGHQQHKCENQQFSIHWQTPYPEERLIFLPGFDSGSKVKSK
jgi:hypothetical protein